MPNRKAALLLAAFEASRAVYGGTRQRTGCTEHFDALGHPLPRTMRACYQAVFL